MATSVLIIEELTGKKRRLELKGAGLPFRGASWGGTQLVATSWNAGNPNATQHVLGPQELPSDWEGYWNTTRVIATPCVFVEGGTTREVVVASTLRDIVDDFRIGGQLLRVTWVGRVEQRTTKMVRLGTLTEFVARFYRGDDIRWTATFEWTGRGDQPSKIAFRNDDLLAASRRTIIRNNEIAAAIELANLRAQNRRKNAASTFSLGQLEALADGPRQLVDSFARFAKAITNRTKHLGDLLLKVRDTPSAILGQFLDVANNAIAVSNQFVDAISREGPETTATRNKVSIMTRTANYYSGAQTQAELMASANEELARIARKRQSKLQASSSNANAKTQDILAIHIPRQGETMYSIAMKYYGSDLSGELSKANALPSYTITPPRMPLIIPTRSVFDSKRVGSV